MNVEYALECFGGQPFTVEFRVRNYSTDWIQVMLLPETMPAGVVISVSGVELDGERLNPEDGDWDEYLIDRVVRYTPRVPFCQTYYKLELLSETPDGWIEEREYWENYEWEIVEADLGGSPDPEDRPYWVFPYTELGEGMPDEL